MRDGLTNSAGASLVRRESKGVLAWKWIENLRISKIHDPFFRSKQRRNEHLHAEYPRRGLKTEWRHRCSNCRPEGQNRPIFSNLQPPIYPWKIGRDFHTPRNSDKLHASIYLHAITPRSLGRRRLKVHFLIRRHSQWRSNFTWSVSNKQRALI